MKLFKIDNYNTRLLCLGDTGPVRQLCDRCADYFNIVEGLPPSGEAVQDILESLPPGKGPEDKSVIGVFGRDGRLCALADLIDGYPETGTWMLGLLLIDPAERKAGLGRNIHKGLVQMAAKAGMRKIRIGLVQENTNAVGFWTHLGYMETNRVERHFGVKDHTVIVMEYTL